jgi:BirA family transcriptional regulator, biotin operon repressor / biotin---[acetyl-CoA-carboxylase] ligase
MNAELLPRREALDEAAVADAVLPGSRLFTSVRVVAETGSTNADLLAAARCGARPGPGLVGAVLAAENQTAGRGRLDRRWQSQPGAALTFSVLLRPAGVPPSSRGWLPLLAGVAVASALSAETGVDVQLKWPNDVLASPGGAGPGGELANDRVRNGGPAGPSTDGGERTNDPPSSGGKLAGILAEQAADAVVVGIGLNVSSTRDELPSAQATSLWLAGAAAPDRQSVLVGILRQLEYWYLRWADGPDPGDAIASGLRAEYLRWCATVGRDVRVELPGGTILTGRASDVDRVGQLVIRAGDGSLHPVSAGDVVHVR